MATPRPDTPAHRAMARARSVGSVNTLARIDRVAGMTKAAPRPWTARMPMSGPGESTSEQPSEPGAEDQQADHEAPLRPRRSPVLPAMSRKLAKTIV